MSKVKDLTDYTEQELLSLGDKAIAVILKEKEQSWVETARRLVGSTSANIVLGGAVLGFSLKSLVSVYAGVVAIVTGCIAGLFYYRSNHKMLNEFEAEMKRDYDNLYETLSSFEAGTSYEEGGEE